MIHIVVDSVAYLAKDYMAEHNITCVPLSYDFEGQNYVEGFPGEFDAFFEQFKKSKSFPTTSQPPMGDFLQVFDKLTENPEDEVICVTLSSGISGTFNSAKLAQAESRTDRIHVVDSTLAAALQGYLVELAVKLRREGKTAQEIVRAMEMEIPHLHIDILVDNLEYLKRGGRISKSVAAIGGMLGIKPIITFVDGKLEMKSKARGMNKALDAVFSEIPKETRWVRIHHILARDKAEEVMARVKDTFPEADVDIWELGPVVGCHVGPGTIGIAYHTGE